MRRWIPWLAFVLSSLPGCDDDFTQLVFDVRLVDGDDGNPAAGTDATALRISIQEGDLPVRTAEYPVSEGDFDAGLELAALSFPTRIRVTIEGPTTELLAAPPAFVPAASAGFIRMVATAPLSCELVTFDAMEEPRAFFGMVPSGTFALIAGGAASAAETQVEFFDALEWETRPFAEDLALSELGRTRAASIEEGRILVLPDDAAPFIFDMLDRSDRITPVVLHVGAGAQSGLVSVPGLGAMVIGGESGGRAQSAVSLVRPGGVVSSLQLGTPRSGPAATTLGTDVLVAGGDSQGTAELLLEGNEMGEPLTSVLDGVRDGGFLLSDGQSEALWMGGTDAGGTLREDTVHFEGCPSSCAASSGPDWTAVRTGSLQLAGSSLIIGGEGSDLVEEVQWTESGPEIQPLLRLEVPRAGAGGLLLESGAFIVAGGDDGQSIRDDSEMCMPGELSPL